MWGIYSWEEFWDIDLSLMGKYIYLVGGADTLFDGTEDVDYNSVIVKMRYDGTWMYGYYEGESHVAEEFRGVAAAHDDSFVIAAGYKYMDTNNDWNTVYWTRFDSNGNVTHRYYFGQCCYNMQVNGVELTRDEGSVVMVGWSAI